MEKPPQPADQQAEKYGLWEAMIEARRRAYLEAMGYDVWVARPAAAEAGHIGVSQGRDRTLLLCPSAADSKTDLAGDLARALGGDPVWGWLGPAAEENHLTLEDAIASHLITRVFLLGPEPGRSLFAGAIPETLGSATLTVVPSPDELAVSSNAKRTLWEKLRDGPVGEFTGDSG
jgi:hypothetical protein